MRPLKLRAVVAMTVALPPMASPYPEQAPQAVAATMAPASRSTCITPSVSAAVWSLMLAGATMSFTPAAARRPRRMLAAARRSSSLAPVHAPI